MKNISKISVLLIAILATGCNSIDTKSAKVIDSEVEGLEYQCAGLIKYTQKDGLVTCEHTPVAFKIGEIKLGAMRDIPDDGIILPQDIVGVDRSNLENENVKKIVVILQSLDEDKNPQNGIKIPRATSNKLDIFIDLQSSNLEDIKELIEAQLGERVFKDEKEAIEHLRQSMKRYNVIK